MLLQPMVDESGFRRLPGEPYLSDYGVVGLFFRNQAWPECFSTPGDFCGSSVWIDVHYFDYCGVTGDLLLF